MIRNEIQLLFSNSDTDSTYYIESVGTVFPAYVVRYLDRFGVAVPYDSDVIREEFANATLYTDSLVVNDTVQKCLFLTSSIESTRNEFSLFCEDFVNPGPNGEKRDKLLSSPSEWWQKWRQLIGNAISVKRPYAVLGELLAYKYLKKNNYVVEWNGPKSSSHDIVGEGEEFEVKSTTSRYKRMIHIAGQFQLQKEKKLYVIFCRFEPNPNGVSINDVVDSLVNDCGVDRVGLNAKLDLLGYSFGSSARNDKYQLHEMMKYIVDDGFPHITPESFIDGKLPNGIENLEYEVDLSVLDGIPLGKEDNMK